MLSSRFLSDYFIVEHQKLRLFNLKVILEIPAGVNRILVCSLERLLDRTGCWEGVLGQSLY